MTTSLDSGFVRATFLLACLCIASCGGGGSGGGESVSTTPPTSTPTTPTPPVGTSTPLPTLPATGSGFAIMSDAGDPVGGGNVAYAYTQANSQISVTRNGALLQVTVLGDQRWIGNFISPQGSAPLTVRQYSNLNDDGTSVNGSQTWGPEPLLRNCQQVSGFLKVTDVVYSGDQITRLALEFDQRCGGVAGSLRGRLQWDVADTTVPPGPVATPSGLWQAPAGSVPATGNYVRLEGGTGAGLGSGPSMLYTPDNALIGLSAAGRQLKFNVQGDVQWFGKVFAMLSSQLIRVGYYPLLLDPLRYNPAKGALGWVQPTEGCLSSSAGWVAVDTANYVGDRLVLLEMRFEQRCSETSAKPPLHGQIRWSADDRRIPPGPQQLPAGLWQPDPSVLPASGSYAYLQSQPGDFVGDGAPLTLLSTAQDFKVYEAEGNIEVRIGGIGGWSGTFKGPAGWGQPQAGYYGQLLSTAFGNPARGGLNWAYPGRGCGGQGWFAIDSVTYSSGVLRTLDLRFQQACSSTDPVLLGKLHWVSPDPVVSPGPVDAVTSPKAPEPLQAPASGSYVLLDSGDDDFIGLGGAYVYSKAVANLSMTYEGGALKVSVRGDQRWDGVFTPPPGQVLASTASFGPVAKTPTAPGLAGMAWVGEARGCDAVAGSWSVRGLQVSAGQVLSADLLFEQYCDGLLSPLRGHVHWESGDTLAPPGPVSPPPSGLWQLPASLVPADGNYFYLHSPTGAFIGNGQSRLFTSADTQFTIGGVTTTGAPLGFTMYNGQDRWDLLLAPPSNMTAFGPGYYGSLKRLIADNPARGGIDFSGASRGCNELSGWYVIDSISNDAVSITSLTLRFEILCEGSSPPIHGQLRWIR